MIRLILLSIMLLALVMGFVLVAGECIAMDYPDSKFSKWWRKKLIGKE